MRKISEDDFEKKYYNYKDTIYSINADLKKFVFQKGGKILSSNDKLIKKLELQNFQSCVAAKLSIKSTLITGNALKYL